MNLKNKYLSNKLLKWADKRCKTFNIYIVVFLSCIKLFLSYNIIFLSFLHLCITSVNHIIHGSWNRERDRQNILSFWGILLPFFSLTKQKTKTLKNEKKSLEILLFYTSAPKIMTICYTVPEIWRVTDVISIFHFGAIFCPFTLPAL